MTEPSTGAEWGLPSWPPPRPDSAPTVPAEPEGHLPLPDDADRAPDRRPAGGRGRWIAAAAVLVVFSGLIGGLVGAALAGDDDDSGGSAAVTTVDPIRRAPLEIPGDRLDVAAIVEMVAPSVVTITAGPAGGGAAIGATGTGVVLSAEGEIVTNEHVLAGFPSIAVLVAGERDPRPAAIVATDPNNDLAVIRVDDPTGLVPARFADPDDIQVGDDVVAIGYALQLDGAPSVTRGIVSALDRNLETEAGVLDGLIQTDAAISSGNSGGPLVNAFGEVVGINTAVARSGPAVAANNIGFAISMQEAGPVIDQLRTGGGTATSPIASGFLGVDLGNRADGGTGAVIIEVGPDTPADSAGLRADDVVTAVDGKAILSAAGLAAAIRDATPGTVLTLELIRAGETVVVPVTLAERTG